MITAKDLVTDFEQYGTSATAQIGYVTVYVRSTTVMTVAVGVNWPSIGTVDASEALSFASDLMACTHLALECERLLTEKGYVIWRESK